MLDAEETVTKIFPLSLRMKHELSDSLCWAQPQDRPEHRAGNSCPGAPGSVLNCLHFQDPDSKKETWRGKGRRVLQLTEGKIPSFLEQGTGAREFMQLCVYQPLSVCSGESGMVPAFNSPLMHLLMSDLVYYRSLQFEGLLFDIGI